MPDCEVIITKSNADLGGGSINQYLDEAAEKYENIHVIKGNHDNWLSQSIKAAVRNEKDKAYSDSYYMIKERLVETDLIKLADWIDSMPVQVEVEIEGIGILKNQII